jgi:predicted ArsR family transcriptional regulator
VDDGAILRLLDEHHSLAYEQIAAHLGEAPDAVRDALVDLRSRGLVVAIGVGELEGQVTRAASYWRLTAKGRTKAREPGT